MITNIVMIDKSKPNHQHGVAIAPQRWGRIMWLITLFGLLLGNLPGAANAEVEDPPATLARRITTPTYTLDEQAIHVPGYAVNDMPGAPQLPVYGVIFDLPSTGNWQLDVNTTDSLTLSQRPIIMAVPVPIAPLPGLESVEKRADRPDPVVTVNQPDPAIYEQNAFYPASPAVAGDVQWQGGRRLLAVHVFPFQYNPVTREVRYHPDIEVTVEVERTGIRGQGSGDRDQGSGIRGLGAEGWGQESVDATAPAAVDGAVRIRTGARGMHRLTYADLLAAGVPVDADPPDVNPQSFTMTYLGQPIPIRVTGEADGVFDPDDLVIFYAEPYVGRYMTHNVYWLRYGAAAAPASARMAVRDTAPSGGEAIVTAITQTLHVEFDTAYPEPPNYAIPTDADHWFDTALYPRTWGQVSFVTSYSLPLDDPLAEGDAVVRGLLYGGDNQAANPDQSVAVALNGRAVDTYRWEGRTPYAFTATVPAGWLDSNPSQLTLEAALAQLPGLSYYYVYPDWVELSYGALADAEGDRFYAEGVHTGGATRIALPVTGFTEAAVQAYDVRDPRAPVQITSLQVTDAGGSYTVGVTDAWDAGDPPPAYALTTDAALLTPLAVERDDVTAWRSPTQQADYIAIVHPSLAAAVEPLLTHRAGQGHQVATVFLQDIYDEFSFGLDYPPAIRDFLSYAFHYWNGGGGLPNPPAPPRYVLLVGDGHHDFKGGHTMLPNLIPPYLIHIDPWIGETAADNRYASVDGPDDYLPDMAIGRIPARNADDVKAVVEKIIAYETQELSPEASWPRLVSYVAANNSDPAGDFHRLSDEARLNWLPAQFDSQTLYWKKDFTDGYQMRLATRQVFGNSVMVQWFGHASLYAWFVDNYDMFGTGSLPYMTETTQWAFSAHYSCWTGYFINLHQNRQTLGELLVIYPGRGSIAALAPSGKHVGSALLTLEQGLTAAIFRDRIRTVGDAVNAAKLYYYTNTSAWHDVLDTSVLFGDPATRLRLPVQPPTPPSPGITRDGGVAVLDWSHVLDSQRYQVWRGTMPYFDPDAGEGVQIATEEVGLRGAGTTLAVRDDGKTPAPEVAILGDVDTNYFWVVRSQNGDGVSEVTRRVGEFDFRLTPGQ